MSDMQGKVLSEQREQIFVINWFRLQHPKEIIFAIPNGGTRNPIEARNLKLSGVLPGIPDLMVCSARGEFHGLFVEMKSIKGKLSTVQASMLNKLNSLGYLAILCRGFEEARQAITNYMELK